MAEESRSSRTRGVLVLAAAVLLSFGIAQPGAALATETSPEAPPLAVEEESDSATPEVGEPEEPEGDRVRTSLDSEGPEAPQAETSDNHGNDAPTSESSEEPGSDPDASDSLETEKEDLAPSPDQGAAEIQVTLTEVRQGEFIPVMGRCALFGWPGVAGRVNLLPVDESNYSYDFPAVALTLDGEGFFDEDIPVPGDTPTGEYRLAFSCSEGDAVFGAAFRTIFVVQGDVAPPVTPPTTEHTSGSPVQPSASPSELANTGFEAPPLVPAAIAALVAGASLFGVARRLRR